MWPVIAVDESLEMMGFPKRMPSVSGTGSNFYPQTSANTFTRQIESYKLTGSWTH